MRRRFIFPILVAAALAGCAETPAPVVTAPALPSAPADFGKAVAVRSPRVGEDARAYAAREKAGRLAANRRLANDDAFYRDVVTKFGVPAAH